MLERLRALPLPLALVFLACGRAPDPAPAADGDTDDPSGLSDDTVGADGSSGSGSSGDDEPVAVCVAGDTARIGPTNYPSIAQALAAAEDGDEVVVCPGTHQESLTISSAVTLRGEGEPGDTVIEGNGSAPVLLIEDAVVVVGAMTITQGSGYATEEGFVGGGIAVFDAVVDFVDVVISRNQADRGGGVYADEDSKVAFVRVELSDNDASRAAGVYATEATFEQVEIRSNRSEELYGAVYVIDGSLSMTDVSVTDNTSGVVTQSLESIEFHDVEVRNNAIHGLELRSDSFIGSDLVVVDNGAYGFLWIGGDFGAERVEVAEHSAVGMRVTTTNGSTMELSDVLIHDNSQLGLDATGSVRCSADTRIEHNDAGGATFGLVGGDLRVEGCRILDNTGSGAVFSGETVTVTDVEVSGTVSSGVAAVTVYADVFSATRVAIEDNHSGSPDAISLPVGVTATFSDCTIVRNTALNAAVSVQAGIADSATIASVDSDWGTGSDDNAPIDIRMRSHNGAWTELDYGAGANFSCTDGLCE